VGQERLCLLRQLLRAGAGQGMGNQRESVAGCAMRFRDGRSVWKESVGQDRCCGDPALFEEDAVEQTAR
jgi:hypothetical protein